MKHLLALVPLLAALLVLAACGGAGQDKETPLTALEPGLQSASYALGMDLATQTGMLPGAPDTSAITTGLNDCLADASKLTEVEARQVMQTMGQPADETEFSDPNFASADERTGYAVGVTMAGFAANMLADLDTRAFRQGFTDQLAGGECLIAAEETRNVITEYQQAEHEKMALVNLEEGEKFLAENAQREGVTVTDSGLQYEVLVAGDGPKPTATDKVNVHYHGTLINGDVFDSSVDRGEPISFPLNRVIAGWTEGVQLMPVGSKYKFFIPSELAYGERGAGGRIGPNATLIFEVELLEIAE
jgi:FKBP-type peptidyl-prolyl cis-trans isomerase